MELLVPIAILAVMWLMLIRPQQQRVKQHRSFVQSVQVGDDVVTTSGLYGTVTALDDERACLRVAPDVEITVARMAVGRPQTPADAAGSSTPRDPE